MSGRTGLLSALLALQLVVIAAVLLVGSGAGEADAGPFLALEADAVDEIRITDGADDGTSITLTRSEQGWRLPSGLPADADKVSDVLEQLSALRSPYPVATSGGAAERFEVTEDAFQRHVVLLSADEVAAELYLGTSPGYQQVHARRADEAAVHSVGLSNYQLPAEPDEWLDKTLLQPRGELAAVEREGAWRISRGEEGWLLGDGPADQDAAGELARRLSELRVTGVSEAPAEDAAPTGVLAITDAEGTFRLRLFAAGEGEPYLLGSDRREGWFTLAAYVAEQLLLEADTLQGAGDATGDGAAEGEPEAGDPQAVERPEEG